MGYRWSALLSAAACLSAVTVAVVDAETVDAEAAAVATTAEGLAAQQIESTVGITSKGQRKENGPDQMNAVSNLTTTEGPAALTTDGGNQSTAELRKRVEQLTSETSKAVATLAIAKQREKQLSMLEREKYSYVRAASEKVMRLVDNVQHIEKGLASDSFRERQIQQRLALTHRTLSRSGRRLQVIRRLLAGAEVGLVHMESNRKLNPCQPSTKKPHQQ